MYYITSEIDYKPQRLENPVFYFTGFRPSSSGKNIQDNWEHSRGKALRYLDYGLAHKDLEVLINLGQPRRYLHIGELP